MMKRSATVPNFYWFEGRVENDNDLKVIANALGTEVKLGEASGDRYVLASIEHDADRFLIGMVAIEIGSWVSIYVPTDTKDIAVEGSDRVPAADGT